MPVLTRANQELFRRAPDESFPSLDALADHCRAEKGRGLDRWHPPRTLVPTADGARLVQEAGGDGAFGLTECSVRSARSPR